VPVDVGPDGKASLLWALRRVLNRPEESWDAIAAEIRKINDYATVDRRRQAGTLTLDYLADALWQAGAEQAGASSAVVPEPGLARIP
jgi:hypothetical protein